MNWEAHQSKGPQHSKQKMTDGEIKKIQSLLLSNVKMNALGISPIEELQLKYNKDDSKDINQLRKILSQHLTYPSTQIAEIHIRANRLGTLDFKYSNLQKLSGSQRMAQSSKICPCCGFIQQQQTLTLHTDLKEVTNIGISTFLYFMTLKFLMMLLVIMFLIFSIFAIITNQIASRSFKHSSLNKQLLSSSKTYDSYLALSLGSKQIDKNQYSAITFAIQCWLGVVMVSIWALFFIYIKYKERQAEFQVDYDSKTASDYTLMFENLPKNMEPKILQKQLRQYQQFMKQYYKGHLIQKQITVVKINEAIPFFLDQSSFQNKQLQKINKEYAQCKQSFVKIIKQRQDSYQFSKNEQQRNEMYQQFKNLKQQKIKCYKQITASLIKEKQEKHKYSDTVPAFVTFGSSYNKQFLQRVHHRESFGLYNLLCFPKRYYFHYDINGQKILANIQPAPEPEDILWTNLGQSNFQLFKKKLFTYIITGLVLILSFFIIYGLSSAQLHVKSSLKSTADSILSFFISLVISFTNIIVGQILSKLTKYQRNQTYIEQQTSVGLKSVQAVLINSIIIPIIVSKSLKQNIYGVDGLADDVFYLGITNSFLTPALKIIDINFILLRVYKWWYNRPSFKLYLTQNQLNAKCEFLEFSIGYQYIYIVNLFIFVCFFVSLQPVIVVFALLGMFIMYWAQKYCLYNRCKRPIPGNNTINTAMYQLIYLGSMSYTLGSFCWSNFLDNTPSGQLPNIVAAIISIVIFILPYKKITKLIVDQKPQPELIFNEDRIFLPSQYDRLNPSTATKGINDYLKYVNSYKQSLSFKDGEQITYINDTFMKQNGNGHHLRRNFMPDFLIPNQIQTSCQDQNIVRQLLGGVGHNSTNPYLIGNQLLSSNQNVRNSGLSQPLNIATQNWVTSQQVTYATLGNQQQVNPLIQIIKRPQLNFNNGQTVTYQANNQNRESDGDLFVNFGTYIKQNVNNRNEQQKNKIPMNLPSNLFGNMLNSNFIKRDEDWNQ